MVDTPPTLSSVRRWERLADAGAARWERMLQGTAGARIARRPIGGESGQALIRAQLGQGGSPPPSPRPSGPYSGEAAGGRATITIGRLTVRWAAPLATLPRRKASPEAAWASPLGQGGRIEARAAGLSAGRGGSVPLGFEALLARSPGMPLPVGLRERFEPLLGTPLAGVRVHDDPASAEAARAIGAEAFTLGRDVFFGRSRWDPVSTRGLALIAHELTHVAQAQGGARTLSAGEVRSREEPDGGDGRGPRGEGLRRRALVVADHDALELQALQNERALLQAGGPGAATGGGGPTSGPARRPVRGLYPGALALRVDPEGGRADGTPPVSDPLIDEAVALFKAAAPYLGATADVAIGFVPVLGDVYDVLCGLVGRALFTWEQLDTLDRLLCIVGVIPLPFVSGAILRRGKRAANWLLSRAGLDAAQTLGRAIPRALEFLRRCWGRVKEALGRLVRRGAVDGIGARVESLTSAVDRVVGKYLPGARFSRRAAGGPPGLSDVVGAAVERMGRRGSDAVERVRELGEALRFTVLGAALQRGILRNADELLDAGQSGRRLVQATPPPRLQLASGLANDSPAYLEYKALRLQGATPTEAKRLMDQFRAGVNPGGEWSFHFTTQKAGVGITTSGQLWAGSGLVGRGVYSGMTPTPSAALKHVPIAGWGLDPWGPKKNVRIPIRPGTGIRASEPVLPVRTRVFREDVPLRAPDPKPTGGPRRVPQPGQVLDSLEQRFARRIQDPARADAFRALVREVRGEVPPELLRLEGLDAAQEVARELRPIGDALTTQGQMHTTRVSRTGNAVRRKALGGVLRMAGVPGGRGGDDGLTPGSGGAIVVRRAGLGTVRIQSLTLKWAPEAGGAIHRKALDPAAGEAPAGLEELVERSQGFALPLGLRERLERLLGVPLGDVRVHTDRAARAAADAVDAEAFTLGEDVFFARGRYDPASQRGLMLLGHELTHVAQEKGGAPTLESPDQERVAAPHEPSSGVRVGSTLDRLEQQAERNERAFLRLWRPGFGAHTPDARPAREPEPAPGTPARGAAGEDAALAAMERPGPGLPLELGVRTRLERALGADLGAVRLHTGLSAERMAAALEAQAVTHGEHVFLGSGQGPESPGGLHVLAHEATHVLQAQRGRLHGPSSEAATRALESEAYASERLLARPAPRVPREAPAMVLRASPEAHEPSLPAAALKTGPGGALRRSPEVLTANDGVADPVTRVMRAWSVTTSREEFLSTVRDRLRDLMAEELELEAERRETLSWSPFRPLA